MMMTKTPMIDITRITPASIATPMTIAMPLSRQSSNFAASSNASNQLLLRQSIFEVLPRMPRCVVTVSRLATPHDRHSPGVVVIFFNLFYFQHTHFVNLSAEISCFGGLLFCNLLLTRSCYTAIADSSPLSSSSFIAAAAAVVRWSGFILSCRCFEFLLSSTPSSPTILLHDTGAVARRRNATGISSGTT